MAKEPDTPEGEIDRYVNDMQISNQLNYTHYTDRVTR